MQEVRLTLRQHTFPSEGRVRFNLVHLPSLGVSAGDSVDLVNEAADRAVTVAVMADTMVREGQVRISAEDLAKLGLADEDEVLVVKASRIPERKKMAAEGSAPAKSASGKKAGTSVKELTSKKKAAKPAPEKKAEKPNTKPAAKKKPR